ncbi:MAG: hypothetical protein HOE90_23480 [Bacteriovoracaceae bacterium]|nr:hypothetical protein [Bacteriovoracaceae bacterium]
MSKQQNEPYKPNLKSGEHPKDLKFKMADETHIEDLCQLMSMRNPAMDKDQLRQRVETEIKEYSDGVFWVQRNRES